VEEVTGFRLQRILAAEQPDILAVDSLQEIAADPARTPCLPAGAPAVDETRPGDRRRAERDSREGRRPLQHQFQQVRPLRRGPDHRPGGLPRAGVEVIAFENTTDIVVSRRRSPGRGGWSQNRYTRKIHGGVMQKAREIEARLRGAGLDYEKKETKAFGGYSRVAFRVVAPRDMVPVHSSRGSDVQVRVAGRELDRIRFEPLSSRPPLPDRRARSRDDHRDRRPGPRRQPGPPLKFPADDDVRYRRGTLPRRKTAHHRLRRPAEEARDSLWQRLESRLHEQ